MPNEPVTLDLVKKQLKLEISETDEDELLTLLITAARRSVENHIDRVITADWPSTENGDLQVVKQAILLLVSTWYVNREAVALTTTSGEMPLTIRYLLMPLRRMAC